jgi:hypothetical protein
MKITVIITARASAITIESQIPSTLLKIIGRKITPATWKTRVRIKEIIADMVPLFKAVKKDEPKIANPENKNENQ